MYVLVFGVFFQPLFVGQRVPQVADLDEGIDSFRCHRSGNAESECR